MAPRGSVVLDEDYCYLAANKMKRAPPLGAAHQAS